MSERNPSSSDLSTFFYDLLDQSPESRSEKIAGLGLSVEMRDLLEAMLVFDDIVDMPQEMQFATIEAKELSAPVRARVMSMLASNSQPMVESLASAVEILENVSDQSDVIASSLIGTTVGSFRLTEIIGEGGSSVVFRAERDAGDGVQNAALKLLRTGLFSADAQRRFRREQAMLAQLSHPNIARLIEGGVSSAGIPYIAMELIDGLPITHAADARELSIEGRLRWFYALCRAIEAAHAALIVHRDLKPSNVLVGPDGVIKVLDFGIAKPIDAGEATTRTRSISLTPEYAAPEQFSSLPLTTAVDVYALGVILGELLTGCRLSNDSSASKTLLSLKAGAAPPGFPPRHVAVRTLRGDLDAIVATATAEEPSLRYGSASALADEIRRYLDGEPVRARGPSRWYRAQKFISRHRAALAFAGIFVCAILASLGYAVLENTKAQVAAKLAMAQANRAESMRAFMFDAFAEAEPKKPGSGATTVVDVVNQAIVKATNDTLIDPRVRIELLMRLAQVLGAQGDLTRSGSMLTDLVKQSADRFGPTDPLTYEVRRLAAVNLRRRGELEPARQQVDDLLSQVPQSMIELRVNLKADSASIASSVRDRARAVEDSREAVELSRQSSDDDLQMRMLNDYAVALLGADNLDEAISVFTQVLALERQRFGEQSEEVAGILSALARASRRAGDLDRSEAYVRSALKIDSAIYSGDHWIEANHLNALTQTLVAKHDLEAARKASAEDYRMNEATLGASHPETIIARQSLAAVEINFENYSRAIELLEKALSEDAARFGEHHWRTAYVRTDYGYAVAQAGRRETGTSELDLAIKDLQALPDPDPHALARALERRVRLALENSDPHRAALDIDSLSQASLKASKQTGWYWTGRVDCLRAEIYLQKKDAAQANESAQACERAVRKERYPDPVLLAESSLVEASATLLSGNVQEARRQAETARSMLRDLKVPATRLKKLAQSLPG